MIQSLPLLLAVLAQAQAPVSFEAALSEIRVQAAAFVQAEAQEALAVSEAELRNLSWDARRLESAAERAKWSLQDVRRRLKPEGRRDGILDSDIRRLGWTLRDLRWDVERLEREERTLLTRLEPDAALVSPAAELRNRAGWLKSELGWLSSELRFAYFDFQRAGYRHEHWQMELDVDAAERSAQEAVRLADEIKKKAQPAASPSPLVGEVGRRPGGGTL